MDERVRCEHSDQVSEWMSLALDGLLDVRERLQMDAHLAVCPACQVEWNATQRVSTILRKAPLAGPSLGFASRVERRLEERSRRRRLFGRVAILSGSLPLAGATVGALVLLIVLGVTAYIWLASQPAIQEGSGVVSQVASGLGLLGRGASLFLRDVLLRWGLPVWAVLSVGLALVSGVWAWCFSRRSVQSPRNGVA